MSAICEIAGFGSRIADHRGVEPSSGLGADATATLRKRWRCLGLGEIARQEAGRFQLSVRSSRSSHMSTDARVPGVSDESIALKTLAPASMSSALSKY